MNLILFLFITANFLAAENLVTLIVGFVASLGLTQWIKKQTGLAALGATILAFVVSFAVALAAIVINALVTGDFSVEAIASQGLNIFAMATLAYKLFLADK